MNCANINDTYYITKNIYSIENSDYETETESEYESENSNNNNIIIESFKQMGGRGKRAVVRAKAAPPAPPKQTRKERKEQRFE